MTTPLRVGTRIRSIFGQRYADGGIIHTTGPDAIGMITKVDFSRAANEPRYTIVFPPSNVTIRLYHSEITAEALYVVLSQNPTCRDCRWFTFNSCRRHSPIAKGRITTWPAVGPNDWCGEFEVATSY